MKSLFALLCLLLPLSSLADDKADDAAYEAAAQARKVEMIKSKPPRSRVVAILTFEDSDYGGEGGYVGHWADFKTNTFESFAKAPEFSYTIELVEWVAGPWFERADIRLDQHETTGLQDGWTVDHYVTADSAVNVIDVTVMSKINGHKVFQQKITLTYDMRTKPVRAYLLQTENFDVDSVEGKNKRVSVAAQAGICEASGE